MEHKVLVPQVRVVADGDKLLDGSDLIGMPGSPVPPANSTPSAVAAASTSMVTPSRHVPRPSHDAIDKSSASVLASTGYIGKCST
jgi:hypothetical protein